MTPYQPALFDAEPVAAIDPARIWRAAQLSDCGLYRWSLQRDWRTPGAPIRGSVLWIMLNPSTADAAQDDPTIRRCITFTQRFGYDALTVVNLFAYRATEPKELRRLVNRGGDPTGGPPNDRKILYYARCAPVIVAAWGALGALWERDRAVLALLQDYRVHCLGTTAEGHPRHPLYLPAVAPLVPLERR